MPTTNYTSSLRLEQQPTGGNANTWGTKVDTNFGLIDDALAGQVSADMTLGSKTLTAGNAAVDEARNAAILIAGIPTSANSIFVPATKKQYVVRAEHTSVSGGITVKTNLGTGQTFFTGQAALVYCDGVSVHRIGLTSALDPSENLADLNNTSAALDNLGIEYLTSASTLNNTLEVTSGTLGVNVCAIFEVMWPIGSLYSNRTDATNPGTLIGFGTWVSAGTGRVPIGVGTGVDINGVSVNITALTCGGEYEHTQTTAELVPHVHTEQRHNFSTGDANGGIGIRSAGTVTQSTGVAGGGDAFNIQQPWYAVYQWVRSS